MTQQVLRRPKVFVSSTVYDFSDLRSALRYWLDQSGYDVQMSEHTDFERKPEDDVFEACFNNVRDAAHYILLIGARKGSLYDESQNLTVTRQEFRLAREGESAERTSISVFIRSDTKTALRQWIEGGRPDGEFSAFQDPRFTEDFLSEVSSPKSDGRGARWVSPFSQFGDIINALRMTLRIDTNLERRLAERNLLGEVLHNIALFVSKSEGSGISSNYGFATRERDQVTIADQNLPGETWVDANILGRLGTLVFSKPARTLRHQCLREAMTKGLFLEYDPGSQALETTVEHEALSKLYDAILALEEFRSHRWMEDIDAYFLSLGKAANQGRLGRGANTDSEKLATLLALHDRMDDVFQGLVKLARWLYGSSDTPATEGRPLSPIDGMSEKTSAERVSVEELHWALTNAVFPFGTNLDRNLRELVREIRDEQVQQVREVIPLDYMDDKQIRELISDSMDALTVDGFPGVKPVERRSKRNA